MEMDTPFSKSFTTEHSGAKGAILLTQDRCYLDDFQAYVE